MIPPEQGANFVAKMTGVLSVYKRPHDPKRPVVCPGEVPRQLIGEVRMPIPMEPGKPKRHDYHYQRNGVVNLLWSGESIHVLRAAGRMAHSDDERTSRNQPHARKVRIIRQKK